MSDRHGEFEELATTHRDRVYRQMLRLCGNREDAEDVLTDALLTAYRKLDSLEERAAFGAWLAQIARRMCFHLRSQQKIREALSLDYLLEQGWEPEAEGSASPEQQALATELRHAIRSAVDSLPPDLREVYTLRDLDQRSGEETAEQLGLTLPAMKTRLHRARQQVRRRMDEIIAPPGEKGRTL